MIKKLKNIILNNLEDVFYLAGLFIILLTTFYLSKVIGSYLLGFIFIWLGYIITVYQREEDKQC